MGWINVSNIFSFEIIGNSWIFTIHPTKIYIGTFKIPHATGEVGGRIRSGITYECLFFKLFVTYIKQTR